MKINRSVKIFISLLSTFTLSAFASDNTVITIELSNHIFEPNIIKVPENTKIKLIIKNRDASTEEFDSFDLNREKVIFAKSQATLFIGPLPKGVYHFFGEYHPNTAIGKVIVSDCKPKLKTTDKGEPKC
jgi:ribosomal protein L31E